MFHKGLWYQNFKQTRIVVSLMFILFIIYLPFSTLSRLESWGQRLEHHQQFPDMDFIISQYEILSLFNHSFLAFIVVVTIIFLAALLIGVERNTRRMDFTFSLPFSRNQLFLAKWLYGTLIIFTFHTINFIIAYVIIYQSEFSFALDQVSVISIYIHPLLMFILFFSFSLFIGSITGEMISQIALTFIFAIFPIGVGMLLRGFFDIHFRAYIPLPSLLENITIFNYLWNYDSSNSLTTTLTYMSVGIILFTGLGILLYERNKIEHNGEFLIFKRLHPLFLIGITICFALFGGMIVSSLVPWNADGLRIVSYWFGFVTFMIFSYIISRRLLKMNLTVKNK